MRKRGILMTAAFMTAALMVGCGSSSSEDTEALEGKKAVSEAAGASSVLTGATGNYAEEKNLAHTDYLPSEYVTLGNYKGLSVNRVKDVTELSEDEKQSALEEYLDANSTQQEITDRPAAEGDYVAVTYKESRDGQVMNDFTDEETEILLGEGDALFEDKLYGTSAGDKVTATVPMENEDGNGTFDIVYDIKVARVYSYNLPELTDAFAKETAGVDTAKELEEQIYQEAIDTRNEISKGQMREDLINTLVESSTVEGYPQSLYDLLYQSVELIVEAVAEAENLIVTQEELDSYKESIMADSAYESLENLEEDYSDQELVRILLTEKVGLLLEENANVTEITEEEYQNLTGEPDGFVAEESDLSDESEVSDLSDEAMELPESELDDLLDDDVSDIKFDSREDEETE